MMLYIFDMGGVLARSFDVIPEAALRMGMPVADVRRFIATDMDALMAGEMDTDEYWSRFAAASGVRPAGITGRRFSSLTPIPRSSGSSAGYGRATASSAARTP